MSIFPKKNNKTDKPDYVSAEPLTGEGLRGILDNIPKDTANNPIQVLAMELDGTAVAPLALVGMAFDPETGTLIAMVYPGTMEDWMAYEKPEDTK